MALQAKTNQLVGPAVTGNSATTDPGFQPKALFTWTGLQTVAGASADAQFYLGMSSSSTTEKGAGYNSDDNVVASDVIRTFSGTRPTLNFTAGTTTSNIGNTLTSFDATGFTLNWDVLTTVSPLYNYLTLGGGDITGVFSGSFAAATSIGNQAVTGVGFVPDVVFLFATPQTANGQANANSFYSFGVATSSSARWTTATSRENGVAASSNTQRLFYNNHCLVLPTVTAGTIDGSADFVSMDADGFTINWDDAPAAAYFVGYMAIKGGKWKVGTETQKTSSGTKATTGVGFIPKAVVFASHCDTTANAILDNARATFGVSTGASNNVALWTGDQDAAVAVTVADTIMSANKCIVMATEGASATPTTNAEAALSSFDSDGFTLNWSTADATARLFGYVAIGSSSSGANLLLLGCG